jgi:hypothetical protein
MHKSNSFRNDLTNRIAGFLDEIGIEVVPLKLADERTFLPGIKVSCGALHVDEEKLKYPGDLLHEARHLAVAPGDRRSSLNDEINLPELK